MAWSRHPQSKGQPRRGHTLRPVGPFRLRGIQSLIAGALLTACGSESGGPTAPPPPPLAQPATVAVFTGGTQTATVGTVVPTPPGVRVSHPDGSPMGGVTVRFEVTAGGGAVTGSPATTDASGIASPTSWTLGTVSGRNEMRAVVTGVSPVMFEAIATPGSAKSVLVVQGDGQAAPAGSQLVVNPGVLVRDTFANPVPGVTVTFSVAQGGGSLTGAQTTTDSAGVAVVGGWTLGPATGGQRLRATVAGLPPIDFDATATAGSAANAVAASGNGQSVVVGAQVPIAPSVRVTDSAGNGVAGVGVTFAVASGGGTAGGATQTTDSSGEATVGSWTLGTVTGPNTLTATAAGLASSPVTFTAMATAGPPAAVAINAGQGQSAVGGSVVPVDPSVRVTDAFGNAVPGSLVTFTVATGGGSVTGATPATNGGGVAAVGSWTLGAAPGANSLTATVAGGGIAGNPVTFTATGTGGGGPGPAYDIVLRFNTGSNPTATQQQAFDSAEARWESVVIGELPDVPVNRPVGTCSSTAPINETVDDLLILITLEPIDGVGGVLGSAGPCLIRSGSNLPIVGRMRFDTADLAAIEASGILEELVLHEMGHVLGVGSLWSMFSLLADPSLSGGLDPHFTGAGAIAAFDAIGGSGYAGAKVPAEDTGGSGTADAHWRESVFDLEVMTGWIDPGTNPLSAVTVASLADFGYTVDASAADSFSISVSASIVPRLGYSGTGVRLIGDVWRGPIEVIDQGGQTHRVIPD